MTSKIRYVVLAMLLLSVGLYVERAQVANVPEPSTAVSRRLPTSAQFAGMVTIRGRMAER